MILPLNTSTTSQKKGMPKRTWTEVSRIYLKKCNPYGDLALDRLEWQSKIHAADPNIIGQGIDDDN